MRSVTVTLNGRSVGTLFALGRDRHGFEYDDEYREDPDATPLSVSMPLSARVHSDSHITPFLWNLLPDNTAVLTRWAQQAQVSPRDAFALLSNTDDLPGGVRFIRDEDQRDQSGHVEWIDEEDVAHRLAIVREDNAAWRGRPETGRWSVPGTQAKIALLCDDGAWGVPHGITPTNRILKPAIPGLVDHDLNEHLCLRTMAGLGLRVAATSVKTFGEERAIVVERYDRRRGADGVWRRVHQEDMCQALSIRPEFKYESDGGPGIAAIVDLLANSVTATESGRTVAEFITAVAFNWIVAGTDAHAKNYSLLHSGREVSLAPFYDVASALPCDAYLPKERLAMRVDTEYRLTRVRREHWERLAAKCKLDRDDVVDLVRIVAEQTPSEMAAAAADPQVVALDSTIPERLVSLVEDRATECARRMRLAS